jgi:glycosyltransferase involved in cell wall biosynthesis
MKIEQAGNGQKLKPSRLRILLVDNSLHLTGAFVSAINMAVVLRSDFDVEIVLPTASLLKRDAEALGIVCHDLPMSEIGRSLGRLVKYLPLLAFNAIRLRNLLDRRGIHVLVMNDYYNLLGVLVRGWGWRGRLITYVRLMPSKQFPLLNQVWLGCGLWASDRVVAVSRSVAAEIPASEKVAVLYDPNNWSRWSAESISTRPNHEVWFLYLGNYISGKGHQYGLHAFSLAYRQDRRLRLHFVGSDMGLRKNAQLRRQLELEANDLGLLGVVTFSDFTSDVASEIASSDVVLNFSESESFSRTCLEASAMGRAVIATRCGGPEEIIDDGVSGILVPIGATDEMSEAMLRLAADENLRRMMGHAGARLVRERFADESFLIQFLALLGIKDSATSETVEDK